MGDADCKPIADCRAVILGNIQYIATQLLNWCIFSFCAMFCAYHASQGEEPGWRERLADVQEEEYYAVSSVRSRQPPSFGPSGVQSRK